MKNPIPLIVIVAVLFMIFGFKWPFIIPAIILYFIIRSNRNKNKDPNSSNPRRGRGYDPYQRQKEQEARRRQRYEQPRRRTNPPPRPRPRQQPKARSKPNPFKSSGVQKYRDFDYDGAIEDFKKALEINPADIPTHFNLACAYSLTEQKDLAYRHIELAVSQGFKEFEKIKTHDAFAYIRIQDDFEAFEKNGFRISTTMNVPKNDNTVDPQLLERLKRLSELRDRGILTQEEFLVQKEKLLG